MPSENLVKIFLSHTSKDSDFLNFFDQITTRVGMASFRSEFETIKPPAWSSIRDEIAQSRALFLLIGKELIAKQQTHDADWEYTQNWIAYEIGVACQARKPVWVCLDGWLTLNFPIPYATDYIWCNRELVRPYLRAFIEQMRRDPNFLDTDFYKNKTVCCPQENCKLEFRLHNIEKVNDFIICPQCLKKMWFPSGFPGGKPETKIKLLKPSF